VAAQPADSIDTVLASAHAALSPWEGENALDAAVLSYNNISLLRQQLKPSHRVHGTFEPPAEGKEWSANSTSFPAFDAMSTLMRDHDIRSHS
jgi:hypothetical protein